MLEFHSQVEHNPMAYAIIVDKLIEIHFSLDYSSLLGFSIECSQLIA